MVEKNVNGVMYFVTLENAHLHITKNSKLGKNIWAVNLLSGSGLHSLSNGNILTNVPGTCDGCCNSCEKFCYAYSEEGYHHNTVIAARAENTLLAMYRPKQFFSELQEFIDDNPAAIIRIHSGGEFFSYEYFIQWVEFCKKNPNTAFYGYTKAFDIVDKFLASGEDFPVNMPVSMSIWNGNYDNPHGLPEFIFDDGTNPEIAKLPHCPAVSKQGLKTGVTCTMCNRCKNAKPGQKTAVYDHSRKRGNK